MLVDNILNPDYKLLYRIVDVELMNEFRRKAPYWTHKVKSQV